MMMLEVAEAVNRKAIGHVPVTWTAWGPNCHALVLGENHYVWATASYDQESLIVYALEIYDLDNFRAWRWLNPLWADAWLSECWDKGIDPNWATDNIQFTSIDDPEMALGVLASIAGTLNTTA